MTILLHNQRERARFLRFAVVGIIGAVVDFGVMNLLVNLFSFSLVSAGTISFLAAILSNFIWNRYWTYPDSRSKPISHQLLEFLVVNIGNPSEISIKQFADTINAMTKNPAGIEYVPGERGESDPQRRKPDISRAQQILGCV